MRRLPVAAFVVLAIATIGAFFLVQKIKVSTPLLAGYPAPSPSRIDPVSGGTCVIRRGKHHRLQPTDFRRMRISFLLLNRADDVDVSIVDAAGRVVDTIAHAVPMAVNRRQAFVWDGHLTGGRVAPTGTYYVQVTLIHQRRTVRISSNAGELEPIHVEDSPAPIRVVAVRSDGSEPAVYPTSSGRSVSIRFTAVGRALPTVRIYRTDVSAGAQLVDSFHATSLHSAFWNGTLRNGRPAPQGTYLVSVSALDRACALSTFPARIPPAAGSTPHAGVTVRYLAAQPPVTAVAPGAMARVGVDARGRAYRWSLTRAGGVTVLGSGSGTGSSLRLRMPAGGGVYVLALRSGPYRTAVPLVAGVPGAASGSSGSGSGSGSGSSGSGVGHRRVLVVMPTLTWQGENEADDTGDGVPDTLDAGTPVQLARPFAHGLPAGFSAEAALVAYLRAAHLPFSLTTDLDLISGGASLLSHYSGIVFAGSERWLPGATGSALNTWVEAGGQVLSFGIDALQRTVTISGGQALDPTAARPVDALLARPQGVHPTGGSLLLVQLNRQGLFSGTAQELTGFRDYQAFGSVQSPARLLTSAGVSAGSPAVIGYSLGRGSVVDVGLPGFGGTLTHNVTAQDLVGRAWRLLLR